MTIRSSVCLLDNTSERRVGRLDTLFCEESFRPWEPGDIDKGVYVVRGIDNRAREQNHYGGLPLSCVALPLHPLPAMLRQASGHRRLFLPAPIAAFFISPYTSLLSEILHATTGPSFI